MRNHFLIAFSLLFILAHSLLSYSQNGRIATPANNGMVVCSHYLASEAGIKILKKGGNAIDAAVATAFALAVTLPSAGNLGGGGFLLYYGQDGHKTAFNFREKAPLAATATMYLDEKGNIKDNTNHEGILSVGVPGTVAGLYLAHQRLGKLKWAELLTPAIELAEKGFTSTWAMQGFLTFLQANKQRFPSTAAAFLKNGIDLYQPGDIWKQPDLASTLKRIQMNGADGFYKGKTAQLFMDFMKANGGLITQEDLNRYKAEELEPIHGTYKGYDVFSVPPPSSGGVALVEMLNMLEGFPLKEMKHNSAEYLHILTEVMRRAHADRAQFLGDPNFNQAMPISKLLSKSYAERFRLTIDPMKASVSDSSRFSAAHLSAEKPQTTHISVMDKEGNAVSLTYTLEGGYGNAMVVKGAGFLLNNEMGDFNPVPDVTNTLGQIGTAPNLIAPEKRMLSSMTPTIVVREGKPLIVIGTPGGRTIPNTVLQVILNVLEHGMNIEEAVEAPRFHFQWLPDETQFQGIGISSDSRKLYESMGHRVVDVRYRGEAMGIFIDRAKGLLYGAADSRSFDGRAVGY